MWKALLNAISVLKEGYMFYVGYDDLSFWYDRWTLKAPFCEQVPFVNIQDIQMRVHDVYIEGR